MSTDIQKLLNESKAEYRQLGKSGLRVSVPILGAMSIGDPSWQPWVIGEEDSLPLLKAAYDKGITTWDTGMHIFYYLGHNHICVFYAKVLFFSLKYALESEIANPNKQTSTPTASPKPSSAKPSRNTTSHATNSSS